MASSKTTTLPNTCPINNIPPELLLAFFQTTLSISTSFQHVLSSVSRQWRTILLSHPHLWKTIYLLPSSTISDIQLRLERSKSLPLRVISSQQGPPPKDIFRLVFKEGMKRVERLELRNVVDFDRYWEMLSSDSMEAPNLKTLSMVVGFLSSLVSPRPIPSTHLWPVLEEIELKTDSDQYPLHVLLPDDNKIRKLTLNCSRITKEEMRKIVERLSFLEEVDVQMPKRTDAGARRGWDMFSPPSIVVKSSSEDYLDDIPRHQRLRRVIIRSSEDDKDEETLDPSWRELFMKMFVGNTGTGVWAPRSYQPKKSIIIMTTTTNDSDDEKV